MLGNAAVTREEGAVVRGSERLSRAISFRVVEMSETDWGKIFEEHGIVGEDGDDILFCSAVGGNGSPLLGKKIRVYECSEYSVVEKGGGVYCLAQEKRRRGEKETTEVWA